MASVRYGHAATLLRIVFISAEAIEESASHQPLSFNGTVGLPVLNSARVPRLSPRSIFEY